MSTKTIDYQSMTDAELYVECADVVRVLALRIHQCTSAMASVCRKATPEDDKGASALLEFGMHGIMNALGDIVSNQDMIDDDDEWMNPLFDEIRRRFE